MYSCKKKSEGKKDIWSNVKLGGRGLINEGVIIVECSDRDQMTTEGKNC